MFGLLLILVIFSANALSFERSNNDIASSSDPVKHINFNDYVDVKDGLTTVLLEIGQQESTLEQPKTKEKEPEYYYVYEYEDEEEENATVKSKSERSASHLSEPSSFIRNDWVPSVGYTTARPSGGAFIPIEPSTTASTQRPNYSRQKHYHHHHEEKSVRTAEIPRPPPVEYILHPQTQNPKPAVQPQFVFVQETTYNQPPHAPYWIPSAQFRHQMDGFATHHYEKPAYDPYTTKKPDSPRNYFPAPDIPGVLKDEAATTLLDLLNQADLKDSLLGEGPFTLFAPTNEAFSKLDPILVNALSDDQDLMRSVLLYHVVPGRLLSRDFVDDMTFDTLLLDDKSSNASQRLRMTKNEKNEVVTVNGAQVIKSLVDQTAKNGVVHFIDEVIYPIPAGSIYDVLTKDNRFRILVEAVETANLTGVLNSTSRAYTIFAPTDDAFDLLPRQAVDELFNDPDALEALLRRHVIGTTKLSPSLTFVDLPTLGKGKVRVKVRRGQVFVEDARLIDGDIMATNGAIQVIDKVLL